MEENIQVTLYIILFVGFIALEIRSSEARKRPVNGGLILVGLSLLLRIFKLINQLPELNVMADIFMIVGLFLILASLYNDFEYFRHYIQEMKCLSYRDRLTGTYNRRFFEKIILKEAEMEYPVSMIMVDIDDLKEVNDTYGHEKGDKLIMETASILQKMTRDRDTVCRFGGDEFIIILPDTDKVEVSQVVDRINSYFQEAGDSMLEVSIGYSSEVSRENKSMRELFISADKNMYKVKNRKKGECR